MEFEEVRLSNLYLTMLQKFGVETDSFADSTGTLAEVRGILVEFSGQICSGSRQDFRKAGESKLLTSSATKLNAATG